jgi:putative methionine-R-sulfoxide reductase with GAF domain
MTLPQKVFPLIEDVVRKIIPVSSSRVGGVVARICTSKGEPFVKIVKNGHIVGYLDIEVRNPSNTLKAIRQLTREIKTQQK